MLAKIKAYFQALWAKLHTDAVELWEKDKVFLIAFGIVIVALKFNKVIIDVLVNSSKALFNSTKLETNALQKKADAENAQANELVNHANTLPDAQVPVGDDWNEK